MVFKGGNIFRQRGGVGVVFGVFLHPSGGQPGDGIPGDVVVFKRGVELRDKVGESSEGECSPRDGALAEGHSPSKGRSFGHV